MIYTRGVAYICNTIINSMRYLNIMLNLGILLATVLSAHAQQIKVTYLTETQPKVLSNGSIYQPTCEFVQILEANPSEAVFYLDSIVEDTNLPSKNVMTFRIETVIYTDLNRKYMYKTTPQVPNIVARDTLITPKWVITEQTTSILSYSCKKAVRVGPDAQNITVWFTTELPIPYGPYVTYGLPGLVLQHECDGRATTAISVVTQPNQPPISMPKANQYISFDAFFEQTSELLYSKIGKF